MKNKVNNSSNTNGEVPKQKERHIVSWSQEEDDILREQIRIHGTDNWAIIASKFNDKTTRQCRRRWFTYLNSDFKKGGWSPEEDMLLCEAQRIFGNRWTEIAKVVSGRTDNAVKNRFTTLCKKRAKENSTTSYINLNNKRVIFRNGYNGDGGFESVKKTRSYIMENCNQGERLADENNKTRGTFLKKDDPKVLAVKVNSEKTDPSLETAWMMIEDFLKQNEENEYTYESSPASSEYSTGSTLMCNASVEKTKEYEAEICVLNQETCRFELQKNQLDNQDCVENGIIKVNNALTCDEMEGNSGDICEYSNTEFGSPLHVTPLFGALAAAIPSPEFSESEKHFLMKTLGMESTSPTRITNPSQPPPCKRSLLHCL